MNIFSKQLLIETTPPTYDYEAYYINNGTMTSLGGINDISKTFAPQDEFIYSNAFVHKGNLYVNGSAIRSNGTITSLTGRTTQASYWMYFVEGGKLYYCTSQLSINQVGSATDWIKASGYSTASASSYTRTFAEASDGLWYVYSSTQGQVSALTGWTKITGYGNTNSSDYYGYGINDGKLYYLYTNGNGAVQQGTDTTWTDITGSYENGSYFGYGINDGKVYRLSGTPTQVGSDTSWTKVSGTARSANAYSLGINGGKLYRIAGTIATQIGSSTDWKNCSGFIYSTNYQGLAYDSSALYSIDRNGTITKLMDGDFVYCGGTTGSNAYAVAIRRVQQ